MCSTDARLHEETGIKVLFSNCFGVGFEMDDPALVEAVQNRDERIWDLLDWIVLGGAEECIEAQTFEERLFSYRGGASHFMQVLDFDYAEKIGELLENDCLSEAAKAIIENYRSGALRVAAQREKELEKGKKKRVNKPGYVYLIRAENNLFKIGKAKKIDERMKPFTVAFPMKWELIHSFPADDYSIAEAELHQVYADKQEVGEWFALDDKDVDDLLRLQGYSDGEFRL